MRFDRPKWGEQGIEVENQTLNRRETTAVKNEKRGRLPSWRARSVHIHITSKKKMRKDFYRARNREAAEDIRVKRGGKNVQIQTTEGERSCSCCDRGTGGLKRKKESREEERYCCSQEKREEE